jgi:hypothetical protein
MILDLDSLLWHDGGWRQVLYFMDFRVTLGMLVDKSDCCNLLR